MSVTREAVFVPGNDDSYKIIEFYKTGEKERLTEVTRENGERVERHTTYYRSGKIKYEGVLKGEDAERDGAAIHYYESGTVEKVYHFKKGVPHGPYAEFDPQGNKTDYGRYVEGARVPSRRLIAAKRKELKSVVALCGAEITAKTPPPVQTLAVKAANNTADLVLRSVEKRQRRDGFRPRGRGSGGNGPIKIA